jgi:hypothetical protein
LLGLFLQKEYPGIFRWVKILRREFCERMNVYANLTAGRDAYESVRIHSTRHTGLATIAQKTDVERLIAKISQASVLGK